MIVDKIFENSQIWNKSEELETFESCDVIGLYFSASWCPPCRSFTPVLNTVWKEAIDSGKKVKIVLISGDQNEADYLTYYGKMDLSRLDFKEKEKNKELIEKYGVPGMPSLVLLDKDANEITRCGRESVMAKRAEAFNE